MPIRKYQANHAHRLRENPAGTAALAIGAGQS